MYWIGEPGVVLAQELLDPDPEGAARLVDGGYEDVPSERLRRWSRRTPEGLGAAEPTLARAVSRIGPTVRAADPVRLRAARESLPVRSIVEERRFLLPLARSMIARALSGPEETLIALAREEARIERALGRENGAAQQWVPLATGPLAEHAEAQRRFGEQFGRHHGELERRLAEAARSYVPNLARLLGPKVAARLVAAAGGRAPLARCTGSRLQLLGSRRRPAKDRGPRFGVIYRAPGLDQLSPERQGRYARSLASLAAIAIRADHFTQKDLGETLLIRRDRRLEQLRRRRL
jgi:hypothetical protein